MVYHRRRFFLPWIRCRFLSIVSSNLLSDCSSIGEAHVTAACGLCGTCIALPKGGIQCSGSAELIIAKPNFEGLVHRWSRTVITCNNDRRLTCSNSPYLKHVPPPALMSVFLSRGSCGFQKVFVSSGRRWYWYHNSWLVGCSFCYHISNAISPCGGWL